MFGSVFVSTDVTAYFVHVIEVVGEGGVDVTKTKFRIGGDYFVRTHPQILVPHDYVHHAYAMARDAGLTTANVRSLRDSVCDYCCHG